MSFEMDPNLLQDFLTESAELIDQLDADLVKLEACATPADAQELCNSCFRALHTIKGAASFLALIPVTTFTHAAEDALNRLRKGEIEVTPQVMDALLQSADVVRGQIESLIQGQDVAEGPADLIERLNLLGEDTDDAAQPVQIATEAEQVEPDTDGDALNLPPQKLDLLEFMVADLQECAGQIEEASAQLGSDATRADAAQHLVEIADNLVKTAEFFELDDLTRLVRSVLDDAPKLADLSTPQCISVVECLDEVKRVLDEQGEALTQRRIIRFDVKSLLKRWEQAVGGELVTAAVEAAAEIADAPADDAGKPQATCGGNRGQAATEQTIRVEVSRLESLLNLVGQLVLNKNRVLALTRRLTEIDLPQETAEQFHAAAGDLDRLMSELQVGVMRTRMQPLAKLFDRYPRVIRDVARMTGKQIDLRIEGRDTEVDKTVLEQLADPLVHLLRNSADHGIEAPDVRQAAGKPREGTIRLAAEHHGSHVRVVIMDDGKGLDRDVIGRKAVEKGLVTADSLAQLPDQDVYRFIFEAGFSTAEQVSDLSGRGVGMDVVRTNISKLNGTIHIDSTSGRGTTIEVLIPLTVAIMPAMVVGVGRHLYSIPLQSVVEIVRPETGEIRTISGHPVMKLRDMVLPLVDLRQRLSEKHRTVDAEAPASGQRTFAVVVGAAGQRVGLMVDELVGQQEIVIKPLDDVYMRGGPFSGATIREDGQVSLILDVAQLMRHSASGTEAGSLAASTETYPQAA